jgi:membrane-associated protein
MGIVETFIDFVLNLDQHLTQIIQTFGLWTYIILFLIVFCETGLVFTPFFPGDSLIFVSGALANNGLLKIEWLFLSLSLAAIAGDTANYWIGHFLGPKLFTKKTARFLKKEYLERTHEFYEKHGGKTIIIARFVPVIRTFAPFVAGIGKMSYRKFITYNVVGGIGWVTVFLLGGYYFGSLQFVKENLSLVSIAIIVVSLIPAAVEILSYRRKKVKPAK